MPIKTIKDIWFREFIQETDSGFSFDKKNIPYATSELDIQKDRTEDCDITLESGKITQCKKTGYDDGYLDLDICGNSEYVTLQGVEELDFEISQDDVIGLFNKIVAITSEPKSLTKYLKRIDQELEKRLRKIGIEFKDSAPQYLINGAENEGLLPGFWPEGYTPYHKQNMLDKILGEYEKGFGLSGVAASFVGPVPKEQADLFVLEGGVFKEDQQISRLLLHGKYSHRLSLLMIFFAIQDGDLEVPKLNNDESISAKQIMQILVKCNFAYVGHAGLVYNNNEPFWKLALDSVADERLMRYEENKLDYKNYLYNCTSPFVVKELLTCFGEDIELKTLGSYLLDDHYKHMAQFIDKMRKHHVLSKDQYSDEFLYYFCSYSVSKGHKDFLKGDIGSKYDFTSDPKDRSSRYEPLDEEKYGPYIATKKPVEKNPSGEVRYPSWERYIKEKNETESTRTS